MIQTANRQNPFPGMNPYLEQHWRDVHTRLMTYLCDQLQEELPEGLWASVEEEVTAAAAVAVAEPLVLIDPEQRLGRHVQIVEAGGRVITVIEVLSATNKLALERRRAYRRKRRAYQDGGVNVVEIDLVRDGQYIVLAPEDEIPPSRRAPYIISVWRATRPDRKYAYPCPLQQPLPRIAVPLRSQDAAASASHRQSSLCRHLTAPRTKPPACEPRHTEARLGLSDPSTLDTSAKSDKSGTGNHPNDLS